MPGWGRVVLSSQDGFWSAESRQRREKVLRPNPGFHLCKDTQEVSQHQEYSSAWEDTTNLILPQVRELEVWVRQCVHSGFKELPFSCIFSFFSHWLLSSPGSCCYLNFLPPRAVWTALRACLREICCCCRNWGGSGRRQQWLEGLSPSAVHSLPLEVAFISSSVIHTWIAIPSPPGKRPDGCVLYAKFAYRLPVRPHWVRQEGSQALCRNSKYLWPNPKPLHLAGIMQKLPDHFTPSCVSSIDGIRELSPCVSFNLQGEWGFCHIQSWAVLLCGASMIITNLLYSTVKPVDSHSNK